MTRYLFIESRDNFELRDDASLNILVDGVRARNHPVTVFLVQNAVLDARAGAQRSERLTALSRSGVEVLADTFSLRERAIQTLADGVQQAEIDLLVTRLMEPGTKAIWH